LIHCCYDKKEKYKDAMKIIQGRKEDKEFSET
jgi:hypothetical protein